MKKVDITAWCVPDSKAAQILGEKLTSAGDAVVVGMVNKLFTQFAFHLASLSTLNRDYDYFANLVLMDFSDKINNDKFPDEIKSYMRNILNTKHRVGTRAAAMKQFLNTDMENFQSGIMWTKNLLHHLGFTVEEEYPEEKFSCIITVKNGKQILVKAEGETDDAAMRICASKLKQMFSK